MKSMRMATPVAAAMVVAACVTAAVAVGSTKTVTISVASLIPGSTPAAIQQFNDQVKQFERTNPAIKVKPVEYQWTAPSFAAKLAARTLPTVFEVPFTDARTLGDNGQLADLTANAKALPYFSKYTRRPRRKHQLEGQIIALPLARAQALRPQQAVPRRARPNKPPGRGRRWWPTRQTRRPARPATSRWPRTTTRPAGS